MMKSHVCRRFSQVVTASFLLLVALCLWGVASAGAVQPVEVTFTGEGQHTFPVPTGVSQVTVTAIGAKGGGDYTTDDGGAGAYVQAILPVTGGSTLFAVVGGEGTYARAGAGYGGAGGGGASDVRTVAVGQPNSLSSRLLVAGGGGGAGAGVFNEVGEDETGKIPGGNAGEGAAGAGASGGAYPDGGGGGAGGSEAGGGGGGAKDGQAADSAGEAGAFGAGGGGGNAGEPGAGGEADGGYNGGGAGGSIAGGSYDAPGGGGGGGYYGGGGGGAAYNIAGGGGGGGGGASYVELAGGGASINHTTAAASITISYVPAVAEATTTAASSLTPDSAQLNGAINTEGEETTYFFEYGLTTDHEATLAGGTVGAGSGNQAVSAALAGLEPEKTYHYRLGAETLGGTIYGGEETFTTPATPPAQIDLELTQQANPNPVEVGEDLVYTLTASNDSAMATATGVTVLDPLPGEVGLVSATSTQGSCTVGGEAVSCALGSIGPEDEATVTITVAPAHIGTLVNTAEVTGEQTDPEAGNDSATADTTVDAPPAVNTGNASSIAETAATLNGSIDPEGEATTYYFEYQTPGGPTEETPSESAGSGASAELVEAPVAGLEPGTTYEYRLVASNGTGPGYGAYETFTTPATPPADVDLELTQGASPNPVKVGEDLVYTLTASNDSATATATGVTLVDLLPSEATLVSENASQGSCVVTGEEVRCALGSIAPEDAATATITVAPERVGALANTAKVTGEQVDPEASDNTATTKTTVDAPPAVDTGKASTVTQTAATLAGAVTAEGQATSYYFEYGTTTSYGARTTSASAGSSMSAGLVESAISGLEPEKTYHYRLVAINATGTTYGADQTFATPAVPTPSPSPTPTPEGGKGKSQSTLGLALSNIPSQNRPAGRIRGYGCPDHLAATFYVQPSMSARIALDARGGGRLIATKTLTGVSTRRLVVLCIAKQALNKLHVSNARPKKSLAASLTAAATVPGQPAVKKTLQIRFTRR
jgi:uncharacterized repeat protein (TIGR01451 family)